MNQSQLTFFEDSENKLEIPSQPKLNALLKPAEIYARLNGPHSFAQFKEDRRVEYKSSRVHPRELGRCFSMWSNTLDGGIIVVGVEDDGEVAGCQIKKAHPVNEIEDAPRIHCPDARFDSKRIEIVNADGKQDFAVVFLVHFREDKVVKTPNGKVFVRSGDKEREVKVEEIREMQIACGEVAFELEPAGMDFSDLDLQLVDKFIARISEVDGYELPHTRGEVLSLPRKDERRGVHSQQCVRSSFRKRPASALPRMLHTLPQIRWKSRGLWLRFEYY